MAGFSEQPIKLQLRGAGNANNASSSPLSPGGSASNPAGGGGGGRPMTSSQSFGAAGATWASAKSGGGVGGGAGSGSGDVQRSISAGGSAPLSRGAGAAPAASASPPMNSGSGRKDTVVSKPADAFGAVSQAVSGRLLRGGAEAAGAAADGAAQHQYKDKNDWTPLHNAASNGRLDICEALLKIETIELTPNNDGNYALHYVVRHGADADWLLRVLKLFLERKANFNVANNYGETPLHTACLKYNTTAVNFLLAQGANPNIKNARGETPLHFAVRSANLNNITQLLRFGYELRREMDCMRVIGSTHAPPVLRFSALIRRLPPTTRARRWTLRRA